MLPHVPQPIDSENGRPLSKLPPVAKVCACLTITRDTGNVAGIVDETADIGLAADRIVRSKTFDHATSCSSENSLVIVDQVHVIATGGSFDNGLPFSLSMGCGTWGKNNFSDNLNYRHYLNITRISRPIAEKVPTEAEIFGTFFDKYGAA